MRALISTALRRLALAVATAALFALLLVVLGIDADLVAITAIGIAGAVFVVTGLLELWPMDAEQTSRHAGREDFRPWVDEIVVAAAVLGAVLGIVSFAHLGGSGTELLGGILALAGVFTAWASLHVLYATHYAFLYYDKADGGVDFHSHEPPNYQDFLYMAFSIGLTYGLTDTTVSTRALRAVVLRHGIQSFVFGAVILAT
ncbi:MAG: DUF1345 domain-containing protein, partial [Brachybacterium sp.]|nr:DUF1345 domain-containing protein [Brachybacterium sp.]